MASTDATAIPIKNQAFRITFPILDADGDLVTGATGLDSEVSKDAGTFADCTNEATEIATSSGMYYLDLTATEMNADTVAIIVKTTSSGAKTTPIVLYPAEAGDIIVNVKQVNGTTQTAGDIAALINTVDDYVDTEVAAIKTKTDQLVFTTANRVDSSVIDKTGFSLSSAGVQAIWDALTSALTTIGSIGKLLVDNINATISSRASQTSLDTVDDFVDTEVAAIKAKTDNLPASPANEATLTTIASYIDTEVAAIKAKTDNLPVDPADASDIAESFATVNTKLDTIDDFLDTEIAAIKAKTDLLPDGITKNTAFTNFEFFMADSSDHITGKTGLTVTAQRSIDGGAFAACTNAPTEVSAGVYKIDLAAADLNGDFITFKFTATGADQTTISVKTNT